MLTINEANAHLIKTGRRVLNEEIKRNGIDVALKIINRCAVDEATFMILLRRIIVAHGIEYETLASLLGEKVIDCDILIRKIKCANV